MRLNAWRADRRSLFSSLGAVAAWTLIVLGIAIHFQMSFVDSSAECAFLFLSLANVELTARAHSDLCIPRRVRCGGHSRSFRRRVCLFPPPRATHPSARCPGCPSRATFPKPHPLFSGLSLTNHIPIDWSHLVIRRCPIYSGQNGRLCGSGYLLSSGRVSPRVPPCVTDSDRPEMTALAGYTTTPAAKDSEVECWEEDQNGNIVADNVQGCQSDTLCFSWHAY